MFKLLLTLTIVAATFFSNQVYSQVTVLSTFPTNPPPDDCTVTMYTTAGELAANNYPYMGATVNIVGFNISIDLDYLSGFAPIYTLTPFTEDHNFGVLPVGSYTITTTGLLDGNVSSTLVESMTVSSCCPVNAAMSALPATICLGETVQLLSTSWGGSNYAWYINNVFAVASNSYLFTPGSAGPIDIKLVVDDGNCSDSVEFVLDVIALPIVDLGPDTTICIGDSVVYDVSIPNGIYEWHDGSTNPTFTGSGPGFYGVTVTDTYGCANTDTAEIQLIDCGLGINEFNPDDIKLFPNPAAKDVYVEGLNGKFEIKVYNMVGELVLEQLNDPMISVSSLKEGVYLIEIISNDTVYTTRLGVSH